MQYRSVHKNAFMGLIEAQIVPEVLSYQIRVPKRRLTYIPCQDEFRAVLY